MPQQKIRCYFVCLFAVVGLIIIWYIVKPTEEICRLCTFVAPDLPTVRRMIQEASARPGVSPHGGTRLLN